MSDAAKAYIIKPAEHGGFGVSGCRGMLFAGSLTDCLKFIAEQYVPPLTMVDQGNELIPGAVRFCDEKEAKKYLDETISPGPDQKSDRPIYPFEQLLGLS